MNALGVDFHVPKSTQKCDTGEKQLQQGVFLGADVSSWNFKMYSTMWTYSVRRVMAWKGNTVSSRPHGSPQTAAGAVPSLRLLHTAGLPLDRLSGAKCFIKCSFVSVAFLTIFLSLLNYQNYFVQFSVLCISSSHHFQSLSYKLCKDFSFVLCVFEAVTLWQSIFTAISFVCKHFQASLINDCPLCMSAAVKDVPLHGQLHTQHLWRMFYMGLHTYQWYFSDLGSIHQRIGYFIRCLNDHSYKV